MANRWEFLLCTPRGIEASVSRIAQRNLDAHRRFCFPASIRYPIAVRRTGQRFHTLPRYLASFWWRYLDARTVLGASGACEVCGSGGVRTHHLCFERLGDELREDLIVLCDRCTEVLDQQLRVGRRYYWKVQPLRSWIWTTKQERERHLRRWRQLGGKDPITTENLDLLPPGQRHLAVPHRADIAPAMNPAAGCSPGLTSLGELLPDGFLGDAAVPLRHPVIPPVDYTAEEFEEMVEELGAAMSEPAARMCDEGLSSLDELLGADWRDGL